VRYLITGGAGFIGSALTAKLVSAGHEVRVLDNFSRGKRSRLAAVGCQQVVAADVRDRAAMSEAVHGVDAVVHLAYVQGTQTFYAEPREVLETATLGMLNVLGAMQQAGVTDLLLVSSSEAYQVASVVPTPETIPLTVPDPLNPRYSYGGGKIVCELMANAWFRTGILDRLVIARPHNIYGPDMGREHVIPEFCIRMNDLAEQHHPSGVIPFPIQGTGAETRSFCYIDDCVDQLAVLLDRAQGAEIYHVGSEEEVTIAEVAHLIAAQYRREIKVIPGALPKGSPPRRLPDTSKIRGLDGTLGHIPLREGLGPTVAWYQAHG
jgi:dTDP-glucose 4,6-dehydratase/UDP-glucose 4-epimerase